MTEVTYTIEQIAEMAKALGLKHDPTGPADNPAHGPGGLFSEPGVRPLMYSAVQQPNTFMSALPLVQSRVYNELTSILTGVTDETGENAEDFCGDPATTGNLKKCTSRLQFGSLYLGSKVITVPEIGMMDTYADVDRQIANVASSNNPLVPDALRATGVNFRSALAKSLYELYVSISRSLARVEVDGDSSKTTGILRGFIKEFDGLSLLIRDGYFDFDSLSACPAADSLVEDWGDNAVDATVNGLTLPQLINDMYFSRKVLASDVGMDGVQWALVMDKRLFRALVYIFACTYAYARCTDYTDATPGQRNQDTIEARALAMMRGQYLILDGEQVPVLFTSGAEVDTETSPFVASIFLVPMAWNGTPLTYLQYFPMNNDLINAFNGFANTTRRQTMNNGAYMAAIRSNGFCDQILIASMMRMRVDTPFLGARIDGIEFGSYVGYRNWDPTGSSFYNGGVTLFDSAASQDPDNGEG